jgi:hypothetical protein
MVEEADNRELEGEKQELICSQATKFSLEAGEERAIAESLSQESTALLPNSTSQSDC